MGGGPSESVQRQQAQIAQQQQQTAQQYEQLSQQALGKMDTLTQPAISHDTNLINAANKGNYNQLISAAGPAVGTISQGAMQAKQNIMNTIPQGAGRDAVLASIPLQQANQTSAALNQAYNSALGNLTQIGAAYGGVGLQEGTTSLAGFQGAANTTGQLGEEQVQGKANTLGFIGSLAGAAGTAAGGGAFKF
jgi:hypothetical protein